jgi:hypothetical protein
MSSSGEMDNRKGRPTAVCPSAPAGDDLVDALAAGQPIGIAFKYLGQLYVSNAAAIASWSELL